MAHFVDVVWLGLVLVLTACTTHSSRNADHLHSNQVQVYLNYLVLPSTHTLGLEHHKVEVKCVPRRRETVHLKGNSSIFKPEPSLNDSWMQQVWESFW